MKLSRRQFLKNSGYGFAAAGLTGVAVNGFADPLGIPVGLQLYTLGAELKKDFEGTLQKVAAIGIREVELVTYPDRKPADVRRALSDAGLTPVSLHANSGKLNENAQQQIDYAREIGVKYFICASPVPPDASRVKPASAELADRIAAVHKFNDGLTLDVWRWNADFFNQIGEQTKKVGIQFGYHNHNIEFRRLDGVVAYDELLQRTTPELVTMELDCGWSESSKVDTAGYLKKYPGRFQLLHLKDIKARSSAEGKTEMASAEVGYGIIDWKEIFAAAKQGGVRHHFIEQEPPFERPVLESVRMSYNWLHALT